MAYTNLGKTGTPIENPYHGMVITQRTAGERSTFAASIGDNKFCIFKWRGFDSWKHFGAFIINSGDSLYFYNGPSYKNSYEQPQFENANKILQGISFEHQTISFTIGVFWITLDNYRYLLDWLNPYEKNTLSFGFNETYCYDVKLAGIKDSTRRFLGYENNEPAYYTEFQLTFDVLGSACARKIEELETTATGVNSASFSTYKPDIKTPFIAKITNMTLSANTTYGFCYNATSAATLFTFTPNVAIDTNAIIIYDSEDSLLYYKSSESATTELLSCTIYNSSGTRLFTDFDVKQFYFPGALATESSTKKDINSYPFQVCSISSGTYTQISATKTITCYPRTNII